MRIKRDRLTFKEQMLSAERIPAILAGIVSFTYILLLSGLVFKELTRNQTFTLLAFMSIIILFIGVILAPLATSILTDEISGQISRVENNPSTEEERTALVKKLMKLPGRMAVQVFLAFVFAMTSDILFLVFF